MAQWPSPPYTSGTNRHFSTKTNVHLVQTGRHFSSPCWWYHPMLMAHPDAGGTNAVDTCWNISSRAFATLLAKQTLPKRKKYDHLHTGSTTRGGWSLILSLHIHSDSRKFLLSICPSFANLETQLRLNSEK